jgi:lipid II:glycine glycyltransferase (peptidoglycan interpeptide bridge formation enzyme)
MSLNILEKHLEQVSRRLDITNGTTKIENKTSKKLKRSNMEKAKDDIVKKRKDFDEKVSVMSQLPKKTSRRQIKTVLKACKAK